MAVTIAPARAASGKSVDRMLTAPPGAADPQLPRSHAELFKRRVASPSIRRMLGAAVESFAKKGFHASTTRDIAAKAKLSPAAVYMHFSAKEQLLYAIAVIVAEWVLEELEKATQGEGTAAERLHRLVRTHVACHASMHTAVHVANFEFQALETTQRRKVIRIRDATEQVIFDCLKDGAARGEFRSDELRLLTITVLSLGVSVSRWFSPRGHLTPLQLGEFYASLVARMVGTESTGVPVADANLSAPPELRRARASR